MNEATVVVEPSDSAIKLVVGYVLEKEPIILYATSFPIKDLIKNGNIVDIKTLANCFKKITHIEDEKTKIRFNVRNIVLVLPPIGLEIYEDKKTTSIVDNANQITSTDLNNVIQMIQRCTIRKNYSFLDIIPIHFYLSGGKMMEKSPLGLTSSFLTMKAILYTLPTSLIRNYQRAIEYTGIKINHYVIAPSSIAHLLANEKEISGPYIFMDVGSYYTTLSIIKKTVVYSSSYFTLGGQQLTEMIATNFHLDEIEAEKLKRRYGYDSRELTFDPIISSSKINNQDEQFYKVSDLNNLISNYLQNYFYTFETCLNEMISSFPEDKRIFPIIVGGGGARLGGFIELFKKKYPDYSIRSVPLRTIGTRHEQYLNCVGTLIASDYYFKTLDSMRLNSKNNLSTNEKK